MQVIYPQRPVRMNGLLEDLLNTPIGQQVAQAGSQLVGDQLKKNINAIGLYTAYSEPVVFKGADIARFLPDFKPPATKVPAGGSGTGAPKKSLLTSISERVKPTIVIDTSFGRKVIAPYGEATPTEYKTNQRNLLLGVVGIVALYTAGAYYLGYKAGKRSKP